MASVTSLDGDLRRLRLEKYTPAAADEARAWIEETLGESLPSKDLLDGLKDGVALCKLINLAVPAPGIKFKKSAMPFVQMENISHFLRACQAPPLNLHQHDTFLTVDLFERKDPAQVLQCIGAFSRAAHAANPANFPHVIGPKSAKPGAVTPQGTGAGAGAAGSRGRGTSFTGDSAPAKVSPAKSTGKGPGSPKSVSTWSKKEHEGSTAPAWNIAQYGYMGGASQGSMGVAFGARRQITSAAPQVPSLAEKERIRKEKIAEEERQRQEAQARRQAQLEDENRARAEEEKRWQEETERQREEERQRVQREKKGWEEQERQWKLTEDKRRREEAQAEARIEEERRAVRSPAKLHGQFLSQYQAEQANAEKAEAHGAVKREQLHEAQQREAEYERDRQERAADGRVPTSPNQLRPLSRGRPDESRSPRGGNASQLNRHESYSQGEREVLQTKWKQHQESLKEDERQGLASSPLPRSPRPLPNPNNAAVPATGGRPLPDPAKYSSPPREAPQNRTDRFLATNSAPAPSVAQQTYARELGATEERDAEDRRRIQGQDKTKAAGWASKSLLEREKEMERQRQKEWEEAQKKTAAMTRGENGVDGIGGGIDGRWDVGQWSGYTGGDGQNKGSQGIGAGRRQIVGPRPPPNGGR
ncbi:hypothetical protein MKX08_004742 [Trichoderma sp. CBMAI-0020]|nr:hypothetical protein MKX08_004742 [Trichoderma sp. CBMAI-0020]